MLFNGVVVGALGYFELPHGDGQMSGGLWLAALAIAYGVLGAVALRTRRVSDEIGLVLLGGAVTLADTSFGLLGHGLTLVAGWTASAVAVAFVSRRLGADGRLGSLTLGTQLALAIGHTLLFEATPRAIAAGAGDTALAASALAAITVGAFAAARLAADERGKARSARLDRSRRARVCQRAHPRRVRSRRGLGRPGRRARRDRAASPRPRGPRRFVRLPRPGRRDMRC